MSTSNGPMLLRSPSRNKEDFPCCWPNKQTGIACTLMFINSTNACEKMTNGPLYALNYWATCTKVADVPLPTIPLPIVSSWSMCTRVANVPLRVLDSLIALKEKNYTRIAFNVIGLSAVLLFPKAYLVAVGVDFISEGFNAYRLHSKKTLKSVKSENFKEQSLKSKFNPSIREDALKILGLEENDAKNLEAIKKKYESCIASLEELRKKTDGLISANVRGMIEYTQTAYQTLNSV